MEKECFDSWDFFVYDACFRVYEKLKILVFIKNASPFTGRNFVEGALQI